MANWYVSSVAYAAISAFAVSTAYTLGQIVRPTAAAVGKKLAYRCTVAGTTNTFEPTWGIVYGGTTVSGGATFTCVNADTYGWSGAAGDVASVTNTSSSGFATAGDTVFLSNDHSESTSTTFGNFIGGSWTSVTTSFISVNRAGSVPPVAGDITSGAIIGGVSAVTIDPTVPIFVQGVTFQASVGSINFGSGHDQSTYLKNCLLQIVSSTSSYRVTTGNPAKVVLDNTPISFGSTSQGISSAYAFDLQWINTPSALPGSAPAILFIGAVARLTAMLRGVDVSAVTGAFVGVGAYGGAQALLDGCKVATGVAAFSGTASSNLDLVELVNCWDGTNVRNERYHAAGGVKTERTITLTGGAADDVSSFSLKMTANASHIDKYVEPLASFWFDVENTLTGSSKTATVEIVSSSSLNNDDVWLQLEYMGTSGSQVVSFANSLPATPLTANAAVTSSSAGWNSSPSTPTYQHLQVSFTPQVAGRVRGRVMLGKASATIYVNPNIVIT